MGEETPGYTGECREGIGYKGPSKVTVAYQKLARTRALTYQAKENLLLFCCWIKVLLLVSLTNPYIIFEFHKEVTVEISGCVSVNQTNSEDQNVLTFAAFATPQCAVVKSTQPLASPGGILWHYLLSQ